MNIFFLSICIKRCARYHFDRHVIKMILEMCQLLSTAWHMLDGEPASKLWNDSKIYKKTHYNHPSAVWTRAHLNNYNYVVDLALELCNEWRFRYKHSKIHGCETKLKFLKDNPPPSIKCHLIEKSKKNPLGFTLPMPQAMPDDCKVIKLSKSDGIPEHSVSSCIRAYRTYYMSKYKEHLRSWTQLDVSTKSKIDLDKPNWWKV